jgi:DNA repair photolyase
MITGEIEAKTILVKSNLPDSDYAINCYVGCRFSCSYCYASFMGRFVDKSIAEWGEFVYAKVNAPEVLATELRKLHNKGRGKTVLLSSVTDPFQGIETKYHLSERCLGVLANYGFEGEVSVLTKSPLVLKAMPTLKRLKHSDVGITITTSNDEISRYFEKFAPSASSRINALKTLNENGIKTYAFFGPLLPHFVTKEEEVRKTLDAIHETGTRKLFIENINLAPYIRERMLKEIKNVDKAFLEQFYSSQSKDYREGLNQMIYRILKDYDFELMEKKVLFHKEDRRIR